MKIKSNLTNWRKESCGYRWWSNARTLPQEEEADAFLFYISAMDTVKETKGRSIADMIVSLIQTKTENFRNDSRVAETKERIATLVDELIVGFGRDGICNAV